MKRDADTAVTDIGKRSFSCALSIQLATLCTVSCCHQLWHTLFLSVYLSLGYRLTCSILLIASLSVNSTSASEAMALWRSTNIILLGLWSLRATDSIIMLYRPSVRLSVTRVDQSKSLEVRIMQLSPPGSPMTLVSSRLTSPRNCKGNIGSEGAR